MGLDLPASAADVLHALVELAPKAVVTGCTKVYNDMFPPALDVGGWAFIPLPQPELPGSEELLRARGKEKVQWVREALGTQVEVFNRHSLRPMRSPRARAARAQLPQSPPPSPRAQGVQTALPPTPAQRAPREAHEEQLEESVADCEARLKQVGDTEQFSTEPVGKQHKAAEGLQAAQQRRQEAEGRPVAAIAETRIRTPETTPLDAASMEEIQALQRQLAETKHRAEELRREAEAKEERLEELQAAKLRVAQAETALAEEMEQVKALKAKVKEKEEELLRLKRGRAEHQQAAVRAELEAEIMREDLQAAEARLTGLQHCFQEADAARARALAEAAELRREKSEQAERAAAQAQRQQQETDLLQRSMGRLRSEHDEVVQSLHRAEQKLAAERAQRAAEAGELQRARADAQRLAAELAGARDRADAAQRDAAAASDALGSAKAECARALAERAAAHAEELAAARRAEAETAAAAAQSVVKLLRDCEIKQERHEAVRRARDEEQGRADRAEREQAAAAARAKEAAQRCGELERALKAAEAHASAVTADLNAKVKEADRLRADLAEAQCAQKAAEDEALERVAAAQKENLRRAAHDRKCLQEAEAALHAAEGREQEVKAQLTAAEEESARRAGDELCAAQQRMRTLQQHVGGLTEELLAAESARQQAEDLGREAAEAAERREAELHQQLATQRRENDRAAEAAAADLRAERERRAAELQEERARHAQELQCERERGATEPGLLRGEAEDRIREGGHTDGAERQQVQRRLGGCRSSDAAAAENAPPAAAREGPEPRAEGAEPEGEWMLQRGRGAGAGAAPRRELSPLPAAPEERAPQAAAAAAGELSAAAEAGAAAGQGIEMWGRVRDWGRKCSYGFVTLKDGEVIVRRRHNNGERIPPEWTVRLLVEPAAGQQEGNKCAYEALEVLEALPPVGWIPPLPYATPAPDPPVRVQLRGPAGYPPAGHGVDANLHTPPQGEPMQCAGSRGYPDESRTCSPPRVDQRSPQRTPAGGVTQWTRTIQSPPSPSPRGK